MLQQRERDDKKEAKRGKTERRGEAAANGARPLAQQDQLSGSARAPARLRSRAGRGGELCGGVVYQERKWWVGGGLVGAA